MAHLYIVRGDRRTKDKVIVVADDRFDNAVIRITDPNRNVYPGNTEASMQGILRQVRQHAEQLKQQEEAGRIIVHDNGRVEEKKQ